MLVNFGKIVNPSQQFNELILSENLKIQKLKVIKKFNLIIVCCYKEANYEIDPMNSNLDNKVLLINFKTGEEIASRISFDSGQIPQ